MNLREYIESTQHDFYYVGAMDGSGFFAIASRDNILDELSVNDEKEKETFKRRIDSYEKAISGCGGEYLEKQKRSLFETERKISALQDELLKCKSKSKKSKSIKAEIRYLRENEEKYRKFIKNSGYRLERMKKTYFRAMESLKTYTNFADREVVDHYPTAMHEPAGEIVIVAGNEASRAWDYKEYCEARQ